MTRSGGKSISFVTLFIVRETIMKMRLSFSVLRFIHFYRTLSQLRADCFSDEILTNPLATPVLDEPPPPATRQCRFVSISTVYNGKFTRASRPSLERFVGAITNFIAEIVFLLKI